MSHDRKAWKPSKSINSWYVTNEADVIVKISSSVKCIYVQKILLIVWEGREGGGVDVDAES